MISLIKGAQNSIESRRDFRVFRQDACTQEREGSTGPSRGEHRLTVYRAHASIWSKILENRS